MKAAVQREVAERLARTRLGMQRGSAALSAVWRTLFSGSLDSARRWRAAASGYVTGGRFVGHLREASRALIVATLVGASIGAGYLAYSKIAASSYFFVSDIRVDGVKRASRKRLADLAKELRGRSIFAVDAKALVRKIEHGEWVRKATVRRHLPRTLSISVQERKPVASVLLGHLYLVDEQGEVFKRASVAEAVSLVVISGITRLEFLNDAPTQGGAWLPSGSRRLRKALAVLNTYHRKSGRPPLSEVNVDRFGSTTLFLRRGGAAIRFGKDVTSNRLARLDRVWAALGPEAAQVHAVFLDHKMRRERVVVRMRETL